MSDTTPKCACGKPARYVVTIPTSDGGPPYVTKLCERWFEGLIQVRRNLSYRRI